MTSRGRAFPPALRAGLLIAALGLQGCVATTVAGAVLGTAAKVAKVAVGTTAKVAGAAVHAATAHAPKAQPPP